MNFKLFLLLHASLLFSTFLSGQISEQVKLEVDKILSEIPNEEPGIIIGITVDDEMIYARGKGSEVLGESASLTPQTPFFLSSISKEFIGVTIAQLVSEGRVNLHAPVRDYITEFPSYDVDPTIYQVLHHTSGVKDYSNLLYFRGEVFQGFLPLGYIIELLCKQKSLNFTPGTEYLYSNSNYELLAEVISRVGGEDFRDYIRKTIFKPIGMNDTYFAGGDSGDRVPSVVGYQTNRTNVLIPFPNEESPPVSVVQLISTINDMALWDQYLTQQLFNQDKLAALLLSKGMLNNGREIGYSTGLEHYSYKAQEIIGHGGYSRGFQSNHAHFKEHGFSIIAFSNSLKYNTNSYTYQVADIILRALGVETAADESTQIPDLFMSKKDSKPYLGSYYSPDLKKERVIYRDQGIMRYNRPDQYESRLVPEGNDSFQLLSGNNQVVARVSFDFEEAEIPVLNYHYPGTQEVRKFYRFEYRDYKAKELSQFEGIYYSEELDFEFEIKLVDADLKLFRQGSEVSTLKVFKEDTFRDNRLGGIFEFDNDRTIKGFLLSQERARNVYFKKQ